MSLSRFLGPLRGWGFSLKSVISTCQLRQISTNDSIGKPVSIETKSQIASNDGRLDHLYKYLWIKCVGHEIGVLDSYETFVTLAAKHLNIAHVRTETPHRLIRRRTLLASRHVHKKYRVQYEIRNYYRNLLFKNITGSTADTFLEYVERNIPEGVLFIAEKHRLGELPFDLEKKQPSTVT